MAKLLRSRDRILLGMAVLGDLLDEIVGGGSRAYHARKLGFYTPPWYPKNALQTAVGRMLKTGLITKAVKKGEVFWELTNRGQEQAIRAFPLLKWQERKWDGWWRIVIFDVAEKQREVRDSLRSKLVELGFGQWQKSVYVSPHDVAEDVAEFLKSLNLTKQASVFVARELGLEGGEEKINRMWHLDKLNQKYETVVDFWEENKKISLSRKQLQEIVTNYLTAVETDPFLPKEFLPEPWYGFEAQKTFRKLKKQLKHIDTF